MLNDDGSRHELATREYGRADELRELNIVAGDAKPMATQLLPTGLQYGVEQHSASSREDRSASIEEHRIASKAEVLERTDRHDPIDGFLKLLPTLQTNVHSSGVRWRLAE